MNIYGCVNVTADNFVMQQHMRCGMVSNAAADASRGKRTSKQLEGKRFGKLTVLKRLDKKKHDCYMWLCKCDCGNTCEVRTDALTRGVTKSCGCMHITSLDDKRRILAYNMSVIIISQEKAKQALQE